MGKAVGGGVYSIKAVTEVDEKDVKTTKRTKIDLESVEFSGHMKKEHWDLLRDELVGLQQKYFDLGAKNLKVDKQGRKSKD